MQIKEIRQGIIPIASDISNAYIDFSRMTASGVAVITDVEHNGKPVIGYGFNSNGRYGQEGILRDRVIPRLMEAQPEDLLTDDGSNLDPFKAWDIMMKNEKPGGHGERSVAVGIVDMALWDAVAKIEGKPLYLLLAERYNDGNVRNEVEIYAAGGYYQPGKGIQELVDEMERYIDMGYTSVKMKVGGVSYNGQNLQDIIDEDRRRIEAVLDVVGGIGSRLAVDDNGRFSVLDAIHFSDAIADYGLRWFEEPVDPLDYMGTAQVADVSTTPIATGENLFSVQDAQNLIRHGGLKPERDILQFDPVLGYGLVEYMRILEMSGEHGWSPEHNIPHGGHQFALHIAAGLGLGGNESYPEVFQPIGGFADGVPVVDGKVKIPDAPGIGIELKRELFDFFRSLAEK